MDPLGAQRPNPDVARNSGVKLGALAALVRSLGYALLATGHVFNHATDCCRCRTGPVFVHD
ncbi:hypothetical protein [Candidatus Tremblayella endosymbiont of Pseudococcus viburni]